MRRQASEPSPDRLPPNSPEAEESALGCILMDEKRSVECISLFVEKFGPSAPDAFYDMRRQTIWTAMLELYTAGIRVYVISLVDYLRDKQLLEQVGGVVYIAQLADVSPSPEALPTFIDILIEKLRRRQMIKACVQAVSTLYEDAEADSAMDTVERSVMEVRKIGAAGQLKPIKEVVQGAIARIEDFHQRKGMLVGLSTGFADIDKMTGGLENGTYNIIAARPSMGKTSLAMNIVEHVAIDQQLSVGVFSLEMTVESLVMRMLCSRARVNLRNVRDGFLAERDFPKLTGAAGKIAVSNLFVDDANGLSVMELRARARRMKIQHGIKLLVIDYVQLLIATVNGRRPDKREREVSEVSAGIKALSKELAIPVLAICQLNREIDRAKRKPVLADLRESGSLEQDADLVGMLYRPQIDDENREQDEATPVCLDIAKQRNGPSGEVKLTFLKPYTRFESAARVSDEDMPNDQQHDLDYHER